MDIVKWPVSSTDWEGRGVCFEKGTLQNNEKNQSATMKKEEMVSLFEIRRS